MLGRKKRPVTGILGVGPNTRFVTETLYDGCTQRMLSRSFYSIGAPQALLNSLNVGCWTHGRARCQRQSHYPRAFVLPQRHMLPRPLHKCRNGASGRRNFRLRHPRRDHIQHGTTYRCKPLEVLTLSAPASHSDPERLHSSLKQKSEIWVDIAGVLPPGTFCCCLLRLHASSSGSRNWTSSTKGFLNAKLDHIFHLYRLLAVYSHRHLVLVTLAKACKEILS